MQERGTPQPGCSTPARPATCNVIVACVLYDRDRQLSVLWMLLGLSCGITYRIVHFVVSTLGSQHRTQHHFNISGHPQRSFRRKSEVPDSMRSNNSPVPFGRAVHQPSSRVPHRQFDAFCIRLLACTMRSKPETNARMGARVTRRAEVNL